MGDKMINNKNNESEYLTFSNDETTIDKKDAHIYN
jgi:hypothetical protein